MTGPHLAGVRDDFDARVLARVAQLEPRAFTVAMHAPITVACQSCHAIPGARCQSPNGWTPKDGFHAGRMRAVAHLDEAARVRVVAEMQVTAEQRRAEVEAYMAAQGRDPAWVAQRDATRAAVNAAFAEVDAQVRAEEAELRARCREPYVHSKDCRHRLFQSGKRPRSPTWQSSEQGEGDDRGPRCGRARSAPRLSVAGLPCDLPRAPGADSAELEA